MNFSELCTHLRGLRIKQNKAIHVVAQLAGRSHTVIRELEEGKISRPRLDTLEAWANAFGCELVLTLRKKVD